MEKEPVVALVCGRRGHAAHVLVVNKPLQRFDSELFGLAAGLFGCRSIAKLAEPVAKFRALEEAALDNRERHFNFFFYIFKSHTKPPEEEGQEQWAAFQEKTGRQRCRVPGA